MTNSQPSAMRKFFSQCWCVLSLCGFIVSASMYLVVLLRGSQTGERWFDESYPLLGIMFCVPFVPAVYIKHHPEHRGLLVVKGMTKTILHLWYRGVLITAAIHYIGMMLFSAVVPHEFQTHKDVYAFLSCSSLMMAMYVFEGLYFLVGSDKGTWLRLKLRL